MIPGVSIYEVLTVSTIIFFIGVFGFITRKNLIMLLMAVELMLNSVALNFVVFNKYLFPGHLQGQVFTLFIIATAAAEVALAIAIVIDLYRLMRSVDVEEVQQMKY